MTFSPGAFLLGMLLAAVWLWHKRRTRKENREDLGRAVDQIFAAQDRARREGIRPTSTGVIASGSISFHRNPITGERKAVVKEDLEPRDPPKWAQDLIEEQERDG